jgi:hypothetical protein
MTKVTILLEKEDGSLKPVTTDSFDRFCYYDEWWHVTRDREVDGTAKANFVITHEGTGYRLPVVTGQTWEKTRAAAIDYLSRQTKEQVKSVVDAVHSAIGAPPGGKA